MSNKKKIKDYVIYRDGSICCYCDYPLKDNEITLDHIVPDSKKGSFNATNLTIACHPCNNKRGNKSFFDYCKNFNFSEEKISKYRTLYFNNLKIKALNIAKSKFLNSNNAIPNVIIAKACKLLKIKIIDFYYFEKTYCLDILLNEVADSKKIKICFDQIIRIIECDS